MSASFANQVGFNDEFSVDLTSGELTSAGTYYLAYRYTIGTCTVYGGTEKGM